MSETLVTTLADQAVRALLYEVSVNPKPGLVDPVSSGPHVDMDVFTFIDSALSLRPYFTACAQTGADFTDPASPALFAALRPLGIAAEHAMLVATQGVNTHKGAIFSLGILVAASAYQTRQGGKLQSIIQAMLAGLVAQDFAGVVDKPLTQLTAGERQYVQLGLTGIRGEAEAGYPAVFTFGLSALRQATGTRNERLIETLLTLTAHTTDSNLVKRADNDPSIVIWAQQQAQAGLAAGGAKTMAGQQALAAMNADFLAKNLSLGGTADLLILTIFLGLQEGLLTA